MRGMLKELVRACCCMPQPEAAVFSDSSHSMMMICDHMCALSLSYTQIIREMFSLLKAVLDVLGGIFLRLAKNNPQV